MTQQEFDEARTPSSTISPARWTPLRTPAEIAEQFGIPVRTLALMRKEKTGPRWYRISRQMPRYMTHEVVAWLEAQNQHAVMGNGELDDDEPFLEGLFGPSALPACSAAEDTGHTRLQREDTDQIQDAITPVINPRIGTATYGTDGVESAARDMDPGDDAEVGGDLRAEPQALMVSIFPDGPERDDAGSYGARSGLEVNPKIEAPNTADVDGGLRAGPGAFMAGIVSRQDEATGSDEADTDPPAAVVAQGSIPVADDGADGGALERRVPTKRYTIADIMDASVSRNTLNTYRASFNQWAKYCQSQGWDVWPRQTSEAVDFIDHVRAWLTAGVNRGLSPRTLYSMLAALKWIAKTENLGASIVLEHSVPLQRFMTGIARELRDFPVHQAPALTLHEIRRLHEELQRRPTPTKLRDRAMLAVGIGIALRSHSIAELELRDVGPTYRIEGYRFMIRFSKTDQFGVGKPLAIARADEDLIDPVRAVAEWLEYLAANGYTPDLTPNAPLFPRAGNAHLRLGVKIEGGHQVVTNMLRRRALAAGLRDPDRFSSHSLRATFITLSYAAGVPEAQIAAISGHESNKIMRKYNRAGPEALAQTAYLGDALAASGDKPADTTPRASDGDGGPGATPQPL